MKGGLVLILQLGKPVLKFQLRKHALRTRPPLPLLSQWLRRAIPALDLLKTSERYLWRSGTARTLLPRVYKRKRLTHEQGARKPEHGRSLMKLTSKPL
jgi:hypothetical protein